MLQRYKKVSSNLHFSKEILNFTPENYKYYFYMRKIILYVLLMLLGIASCTNYDTNPVVPQQYDGVPLVILDTDIGSSTDDLFALEFLYHYQQQGKCKLLGVVVE